MIFEETDKDLIPRIYFDRNGVTVKCENCEPGFKAVLNGVEYEVVDNFRIRRLVKEYISLNGTGIRRSEKGIRMDEISNKIDFSKLCTSLVTDMNGLFMHTGFNQPIGNWDVSNVTDMSEMFFNSGFNQPIGIWDVSKVTNMDKMFCFNFYFNQPINNWVVSNVLSMESMFLNAVFNQPIGNWDVSNVENMERMFMDSQSFNQDLSKWDLRKIEKISSSSFPNTVAWVLPKPNWKR